MTNSAFKKTIFISLLGHLTVFGIFTFSFNNSFPKAEYVYVSFWGQLLQNCQVIQPITTSQGLRKPDKIISDSAFVSRYYDAASNLIAERENDWWEKPAFSLTFDSEKEVFIKKSGNQLPSAKKREPTIIFHPLLPYGFNLYFKDRQVAHVELMYKIISTDTRNSILLKRKISSGNLEVDLLVMRYIGHYLFIQQTNILANNWQTVKIDLSAKEY